LAAPAASASADLAPQADGGALASADLAAQADLAPQTDGAVPVAPAAPAIGDAAPLTGTSTTSPAFTFTYQLPALTGGTPEQVAKFDQRVNAIVRAEEKSLVKAKRCKDPKGANPATGELLIDYQGSVYQGRYASVTLLIDRARPHCGNLDYTSPKSFTLDLTAGKNVKLAKFVHPNGTAFDLAVVASLRTKRQNPDCYKDSKLRKIRAPLNTPHAWAVSDQGVRIWYRGSADVGKKCAYLTGFVPWKAILDPADIKGKNTRTTYWAINLKESSGSRYGCTGRVGVVRTKGNQMVVFEWNLNTAKGTCQVGVRDGSKAIVYQVGKAKSAKSITLNNATSKAVPKKFPRAGRKATKAEIAAIFTRTHGLNTKAITRACGL
jgi:hypothetical protein